MNTFIIYLNDTTVLSDSVVAKVILLSNSFQPAVTEAETNSNDVMIVAFICVAIVVVALIAKWAAWSWHETKIRILKEEREEKARKEMVETKRRMLYNLIEKRIDALKSQAVNMDKDGNIIGYKAYDSNEFKAYNDALKEYIGKSCVEEK